jgi:hypothetical protein
MQFEFYVLNYDCNKKKVVNFNIFNNINVQKWTEKAVRKYLRSPKKFKHIVQYENKLLDKEEIAIYGFDALVKEIDRTIKWGEWSKREYEISVGDAFTTDCNKLEKIDCYAQVCPNMKMITYEVIRQYKEQLKKENKQNEDNRE